MYFAIGFAVGIILFFAVGLLCASIKGAQAAPTGESKVRYYIDQYDNAALQKLHELETAGTLAKGTAQAYADKLLEDVGAVVPDVKKAL